LYIFLFGEFMKSRAVTVTAFILSAALHAGIIGGMAWYGLSGAHAVKTAAYSAVAKSTAVYTLLPDVEIISQKTAIKKAEKPLKPQPEKKEDFGSAAVPDISGESEKESVFRYKDAVKRKIQDAKIYPEEARREGNQGTVAVAFSVLRDGSVPSAGVVNSSGCAMLDDEAVNTIKRASPFPPFPGNMRPARMDMQVSIVYRLN
jgi:TonB family protein